MHFSSQDVSFILEKFGLGQLLEPLQRLCSYTNLVWKLHTTTGTYIMRYSVDCAYDEYKRSIEGMVLELEFIQYLHQLDFPVPNIRHPIDAFLPADSVVFYAGGFIVIFDFCEGYSCSKQVSIQTWHIKSLARFVGHMHRATYDNHKWNASTVACRPQTGNEFIEVLYNFLPGCSSFELNYPDYHKSVSTFINQHLGQFMVSSNKHQQLLFMQSVERFLPKACLHLDLNTANVLFDHNTETLSAVLDFDDFTFGPMLIDLAAMLYFWCVGLSSGNELIASCIIEYERARSLLLTDEEWKLLLPYCYMFSLRMIYYLTKMVEEGSRDDMHSAFRTFMQPIEILSRLDVANLRSHVSSVNHCLTL